MSAANNPAELDYLIKQNKCTLALCPLDYAFIRYDPSLAGNAFYAALFGILLVAQTVLGIRYRTWSFMFGMCAGLLLEVAGYTGRILMHYDPFSDNNFLIYIICLTIGPAFFSAAIYLCLARIVVIYGEGLSRVQPRTYTITFITCDFIALVLQATGGAFANGKHTQTMGTHIMIAGLAFQVVSLLLFIFLSSEFAWRARSRKDDWSPTHADITQSGRFRLFLVGLAIATICILGRSCFRVAELSNGFGSALANDQVSFMILEGGLVSVACIVLTILHAGPAFQTTWNTANFKLRNPDAVKEPRRDTGSGYVELVTVNGERKVQAI